MSDDKNVESAGATATAAAEVTTTTTAATTVTTPPQLSVTTPPPPSTSSSSTVSLTSPPLTSSGGIGGGGGGFFTLGGDSSGIMGGSIAERAKRMKEEEMNKTVSTSNGDSSKNAVSGHDSNNDHSNSGNDEEDDLHLFDKLYVYNQIDEKDNAYFNSLVDGFRYLRKIRDAKQEMMDDEDAAAMENATRSSPGGRKDRNSPTAAMTYSYATVNFIDPTTKSATTTVSSPISGNGTIPDGSQQLQPKPTNLLQQQSMLARAMSSSSSLGSPGSGNIVGGVAAVNSAPAIENVFEKLTYIFERDYRSTLRSVQYKNIRTGEKDVISSLPVHPVLSRTGGEAAAISPTSHSSSGSLGFSGAGSNKSPRSQRKSVHLPWGGAASSAALPASDPSEWHTGPFCHVYIAACENAEHYRTKVKPSLQVFVNQLESVASNTAGRQQGGYSAEYLIVYVPVGGGTAANNSSSVSTTGTTTPDTSTGAGGTSTKRSGSFGSRFQKARQRAFGASAGSSVTDDDDDGSRGSLQSDPDLSGSGDSGDDIDSGATVAVHLLSRQERSLYKKIVADFPNGKVCVLSTVSLDRSDEELANSEGVAIRTQEWNTFNRMLGSVIVGGFKDRCRRYKDELKRLDAQRATAATAAKGHGKGKPSPYAFNLCHFFLVKESLAFSFEQMQLPAETLLQYDEFRLYMPDLSDREERKVRRSRRMSKALTGGENGDSEPSLTRLADAGDSLGFRRRIRTEFDLTPILDIMRRYLFAREMSLLFRMEQPVELLTRAEAFVKTMYSIMLRGVSELPEEEQKERRTNAAKWVVQFIWDVKHSSDIYFSNGDDHPDNASVDTISSDVSDKEPVEMIVASRVSDLLEISRLMLLRLGDTELDGGNPLRTIQQRLPDDLRHSWKPWTASEEENSDGAKRASWKPSLARLSMSTCSSTETESIERHFILSSALDSAEEFEDTYHHLCMGMVKTSRKAKRRRYAARLQAEIGEFYLRKGDKVSAAASFKKILKVYKQDQWDRLHFWRLFRLAYCQRTTAEPSDYLKTLVSCFTPRLTASAPAKSLSCLQDDLEAVLGHPSIAEARYGKLAFIETTMALPKASMDVTNIGDGVDKKQVIKRFCAVGETLQVQISITNHLPRSIEVDSVKLFILYFGDFASILEKGDAIEEDDAAKVMSLDSPLKLEPEQNQYVFEWTPSASGQYILSTVELKWLQGYFYYDSMDLPQPLLGVDVLPSEPTHSISLEPRYLIYGHDQEVQINFDAGSDIITSGKLVLSCNDGMLILTPGQDPSIGEWAQKVETELKTCNPGEKYGLKFHIRTDNSKEPSSEPEMADSPKGLSARAFTTYLNSSTVNNGETGNDNAMRTVLESIIPILEKSALSVESVQHHWLEENTSVMLCILLASNAPYNLSLVGWDMALPAPLRLGPEVDLNDHLRNSVVSDGDRLSFAFECDVSDPGNDIRESVTENAVCKLSLKLTDEAGEPFMLDLPIDIHTMHSDLVRDNRVSGNAIVATLILDMNEGIVQEPVAMTYSLSIPSSETLHKLDMVYSFYSGDSPSWILAGKTSGLVKTSESSQEFSCSLVGVPAVTGFLDTFPELSLAVVGPDGKKMPILVETRFPEKFLSRPPTEAVVSVGYRSSTK